jgi:hypothetical protein
LTSIAAGDVATIAPTTTTANCLDEALTTVGNQFCRWCEHA